MKIIPAIDLKDGKCVRLVRGKQGTETVFSDSPSGMAKKWEACGAEWIHVVDLDGAFQGTPRNFHTIEQITSSVFSNIQVGGGIRNITTVEKYLKAGVARVIIGTSAFTDRIFLEDACRKFPGKIAVGVDTRGGKIAVRGWKETIDESLEHTMRKFCDAGVSLVIHTNVDKDGTMEGVETELIKEFLSKCPLPVIISGGIASDSDLKKIQSLNKENLFGVILGKSIYTGSIDLEQSIQRFQQDGIKKNNTVS